MKPPATHRARDRLLAVTQWARPVFDAAASLRAQYLGDWPAWCYLPLPAWQEAAEMALPFGLPNQDAEAEIPALGSWRMTQGIYRIDPTVCDALLDTPADGDIPADVLLRLPQWCVYVETPERVQWCGERVHGFWAWLDGDAPERANLIVLLDGPGETVPLILTLGTGSLAESLHHMLDVARRRAQAGNAPPEAVAVAQHGAMLMQPIKDMLAQLLPLLLYICTAESMQQRPGNPQPQKTKRGMQTFPASQPQVWDVGVRMGAALRAAYAAEKTERAEASGGGAGHASPRGHIRRAHWHGFRSGPRLTAEGESIPANKRRFELRWMPPIPVNLPDIDSLPSTIYPIK